jgi:hypothetical protein
MIAKLPWRWMTNDAGPEDEWGSRTPGPIDVQAFVVSGYYDNPELIAADGTIVIAAGGGEYCPYQGTTQEQRVEHALYIERACNSFDAMREVLTDAPCTCPEYETGIGMVTAHNDDNVGCFMVRARAALALAGGAK